MKRFISVLLIASAIFAVGCHNKNHEDSFSKVKGQQEELVSSETTVPSTTVPTPTPTNTPTPTPSPTPKIENISNNVEGHYKFNPCVFSQKYEETFGKEMKEAFFRFCEAVRAGEDYFDCPDRETYDWCVGNFCFGFCPVANVYVDALDDTYSDLWDGLYIGMNREEHLIVYEDKIGKVKEFSYAS